MEAHLAPPGGALSSPPPGFNYFEHVLPLSPTDRLVRKFLKFWPLVEAVASMSKDPSTKVGALALDKNFNIISTGYNGFPRGVNDDPARYADRETKLRLVSHAEQNLIAQAAYGGRSLKGATLLVSSLFPCSNCAKSIIQSGVVRVISPHPSCEPRWAVESKWATILFDEAQVEIIHVKQIVESDGTASWAVDRSGEGGD
jgi:dCMP deaminase